MTVADLTATAVAAGIRAGAFTSVEVVEACLARTAEVDSGIHAWAHLDPEAARAQARDRDAAEPAGPLHGVPVGIKDIIDTADLPTSYGSPMYAGHRPDRDAVCVQRLRAAGAVILGKTVTTEFATFHPGPTVNPVDPRRTPGGSSSGSAAAVAAGMVPVALGTQTAGSIIRPAAFCGIWGLKPTFGVAPLDGVHPVAPSLDTLGPLARAPDDLELVAAVLAPASHGTAPHGTPRDDPAILHSGADGARRPRIAFAPTARFAALEPATQDALRVVATTLGLLTVELPPDFADLAEAQHLIMAHEAVTALGGERDRGPVSRELAALLDEGSRVSDRRVAAARALAARCRAALPEVFADVDALVAPAALGEAPIGLDRTGDPLPCRAWTLLGVPTVAVPGLTGPGGAPLGVQVVAGRHADAVALGAARWLGGALSGLDAAGVHLRTAPPS